ncbi:hypothetical protein AB0C70_33285 [Streptomyces sp. NPDC048564]|uniref:hypothetical protein n=1 Tax=unclassified Streptomyces TaxID=2593676 RepID=UPI003415A172
MVEVEGTPAQGAVLVEQLEGGPFCPEGVIKARDQGGGPVVCGDGTELAGRLRLQDA